MSRSRGFTRGLRTAGTILLGFLMLTLSLAGCRNQGVTAENYERIQVGMTLDQVVSILGPNYEKQRAGVQLGDVEVSVERESYVWREGGREIVVHFDDGRVERAVYNAGPQPAR